MEDQQVAVQTWERYSSRQEAKHPLSGLVGRALLTRIPEPLWPYLILGQWVHVGKGASFGQGRPLSYRKSSPKPIAPPLLASPCNRLTPSPADRHLTHVAKRIVIPKTRTYLRNFLSRIAESAKVSINQGCRDVPTAFGVRKSERKAGDSMGGRMEIGKRTLVGIGNENEETKPIAPADDHEIDETKPTGQADDRETDETKPSTPSNRGKIGKTKPRLRVWEKFADYTEIDRWVHVFLRFPAGFIGKKRSHDRPESIDCIDYAAATLFRRHERSTSGTFVPKTSISRIRDICRTPWQHTGSLPSCGDEPGPRGTKAVSRSAALAGSPTFHLAPFHDRLLRSSDNRPLRRSIPT